MRIPDPERRLRIKGGRAELDRFEHQAVVILVLSLILSSVSYAILMQVLL